MSILLAFDAATSTASVAVYDLAADTLVAELTWQARRKQTEKLLPATQDLLRLAGAETSGIVALAVTTGPGSFTGVRIGISTVKGMGLGLAQPPQVVGVPTLCVTAAPWLGPAQAVQPPVTVCAAIQAGRGRYNWVNFTAASLSADPLWQPGLEDHHAGTAAEFAAALAAAAAPTWLVGELGQDLRQAVWGLPNATAIDDASGLRRAGLLAALAARRLAAGRTDAPAELQPIYLRPLAN